MENASRANFNTFGIGSCNPSRPDPQCVMNMIGRLVSLRKFRVAREILALYGVEIPIGVKIGRDLNIVHRGFGTVIHPFTSIGDRVRIYHQVTVGRGDAHLPGSMSVSQGIEIGDDVILFPGCKILSHKGIMRVGTGTIVAANAVLTQSTGEWEIWAGIPARRVGMREKPEPNALSTSVAERSPRKFL